MRKCNCVIKVERLLCDSGNVTIELQTLFLLAVALPTDGGEETVFCTLNEKRIEIALQLYFLNWQLVKLLN